MRNKIITEVLAPLLRRVGTFVAAFLTAQGFDGELSHQFAAAIVGGMGIGLDLVLSRRNRRKNDG